MIVGISGKIGSGKSTLAEILYQEYGYEKRIFAGKLKEIAAMFTGLRIDDMYNRHKKDMYLDSWGMTLGEFQQRLGTDAIRDGLHQDAWVKALFADYTPAQNWSISDVRFPNEAEEITASGGILVRIEGSRTGPGGRDPNHISETALDNYDFDYRFTNNGTREELIEQARAIHKLAQQFANR